MADNVIVVNLQRIKVHSRMENLGNDAKFTLMYEQVAGLAVLLQHHFGVTCQCYSYVLVVPIRQKLQIAHQ